MKAVIFDMDGVLFDTERIYLEDWTKLFEKYGYKVITCPFDKVYKFGGGFHCCSSDIRRRGKLESYFPTLD